MHSPATIPDIDNVCDAGEEAQRQARPMSVVLPRTVLHSAECRMTEGCMAVAERQ